MLSYSKQAHKDREVQMLSCTETSKHTHTFNGEEKEIAAISHD